jgi:hypothetical protein
MLMTLYVFPLALALLVVVLYIVVVFSLGPARGYLASLSQELVYD